MVSYPQQNLSTTRTVAYDGALLFPVLFLVGIGVVMVYSASSTLALDRFGSDYYFLKKQALFSLTGIIALVVCRYLPYTFYRYLVYPLLGMAIACLVLIKVSPWALTAGGATRWLALGPVTFQPSEFARLALVIYLAYSMNRKFDQLKHFSIGFLPHFIVLGIFAVLIMLQPDFGSVVILCAITWAMLFIGGARLTHLLGTLLLLLPAGYFLLMHADYRLQRLTSFLDPWKYPTEGGYQIIHSLMAFGTGGLWGTGIGKGYQKLFYLPEPHTDFIFSVIGEELGLLGVMVVLALYSVILWRGLVIARRANENFGSFLALGLTIALGLQVCINMAVTLGLLPTKGLTLPFLSYGGTSLLINMAAIGILMNISSRNVSK